MALTYKQKTRMATQPRVNLDDLIRAGTSMLGAGNLPYGYGRIENTDDVLEEAYKPSEDDERMVRIHIVWDNPVGNLPLEDVLEQMRAYGAAMVTKVEAIKR